MHAHPVFADFLQHYGSVCARIKEKETLERLGRLFWYTVEFGLIREGGKVKVYGSGVISSQNECTNVIEGGCEVRDFSLDEVLDTPVKVDSIHKLLFAIESFEPADLFAGAGFGPQPLAFALFVVRHHGAGGFENILGGAVVLLPENALEIGPVAENSSKRWTNRCSGLARRRFPPAVARNQSSASTAHACGI